jgi:hypothetical protein
LRQEQIEHDPNVEPLPQRLRDKTATSPELRWSKPSAAPYPGVRAQDVR